MTSVVLGKKRSTERKLAFSPSNLIRTKRDIVSYVTTAPLCTRSDLKVTVFGASQLITQAIKALLNEGVLVEVVTVKGVRLCVRKGV